MSLAGRETALQSPRTRLDGADMSTHARLLTDLGVESLAKDMEPFEPLEEAAGEEERVPRGRANR